VRFPVPLSRIAPCSAATRRSRAQSRAGAKSIFGSPDPWRADDGAFDHLQWSFSSVGANGYSIPRFKSLETLMDPSCPTACLAAVSMDRDSASECATCRHCTSRAGDARVVDRLAAGTAHTSVQFADNSPSDQTGALPRTLTYLGSLTVWPTVRSSKTPPASRGTRSPPTGPVRILP